MASAIRTMRPGARLFMLLSATERDHGAGIGAINEQTLETMREAYGRWGVDVTEIRPATATDVAAAHSTWGKRLGAGTQRPAWAVNAVLHPDWRPGHMLNDALAGYTEGRQT
jgi:16S rRNA (adenine(1408)-N(1))-methyltransferase